MSEIIPSPEIDRDSLELNVAYLAYLGSAALFATSQGFEDDTMTGVGMINRGDTHWHNGKPITEEVKRSYAASSVLVQLGKVFNTPQQEVNTPVLTPHVTDQLDFYLTAQQDIDDLGLSFSKDLVDVSLLKKTVGAMSGRLEPINVYAARASEQWARRGTIELDMINLDEMDKALAERDLSQIAPDKYYEVGGLRVSEYPLPETPVIRQIVPYYKKFYDESQGEEWLGSILEDLKAIKQG